MEIFEISKGILICTVYGLKDCVVGMCKLINVINAQEPVHENVQRIPRHTHGSTVKNKIISCIIFGVCFWISSFLFNALLLGCIISWLAKFFGQEDVWLLHQILRFVFFSFWILPMFFLSKLLNFLWYQDIADIIFASANIKKNIDYKISISLADQFKTFVLQTIYCVQGYVVYLLPLPTVLQNFWYLCHLALLSSLYAFEYKWVHTGMLLHRRLLTIDKKWPYYLGFGFPLAIITMAFESFIDSMIAFATLFPIYIISSAYILDEQSPLATFPLHTFKFADFASDVIISFLWNVLPAGFTFLVR